MPSARILDGEIFKHEEGDIDLRVPLGLTPFLCYEMAWY